MSKPLVELKSVTSGYGALSAIRDVSVTVAQGELVALLGANGAGKTTMLMTMAGWIKPQQGDVLWCGKKTAAPPYRRARNGLAMVPESKSVFMNLSVADNLRIGQGDTSVALDLFPELAPLMRRRAGLLSGGEQQMLTMARALAARPRVLLADELSLGLAPLVVKRLLRGVREAADGGVGVLLVEQHTREALAVCDRGYVLRRGEIHIAGTAAELRARSSELTASYVATDAGGNPLSPESESATRPGKEH